MKATAEGTRRYAARQGRAAAGHFREARDLQLSSLGIGTYLGDPDDRTDKLVEDAVAACVRRGINVIDTAINYRYERAERSIGRALRRLFDAGEAARDEVVICTKGGFIPSPSDPVGYVMKRGLPPTEVAAGCHCMHPEYLLEQIDRSRENLGVETIDVYYVHNPETQLAEIEPEQFYRRLEDAFQALEAAADAGKIQWYGMATWNAFRAPEGDPDHVDLAKAKAVSGERFGFIQLPLNLAMPEALFQPTQAFGNEIVPALEAARRLGIAAVSSASICQGQILGRLPPWLVQSVGLRTDAMRGLQVARSAPGLTTALIGMKSPAHVAENLELVSVPPLDEVGFRTLTR